MKQLFLFLFTCLGLFLTGVLLWLTGAAGYEVYKGIDFSQSNNFWQQHSIWFLLLVAIFPRIALAFSSFNVFGSAARIWGWVFTPRILVAAVATTQYWDTNPWLVGIAWFFCVLGDASEKKNKTQPKNKKELTLNVFFIEALVIQKVGGSVSNMFVSCMPDECTDLRSTAIYVASKVPVIKNIEFREPAPLTKVEADLLKIIRTDSEISLDDAATQSGMTKGDAKAFVDALKKRLNILTQKPKHKKKKKNKR